MNNINTQKKQLPAGYKQSPVGIIPAEWEVKNVSDLGKMEYGYTTSAKNNGSIVFIRITDIDENGKLKVNNLKYTNLNKKNNNKLLKKNDILVVRTGATYGKTLLFNYDFPAIFASYLIRINFDKNKILPLYYWFFTQTNIYNKQKNKLMIGSGQPQFNSNVISKLKIPLPPLEEQKAIAEVLSTWDTALESLRQLVEQKKLRKKWLMQQLLTGKKRLPGFTGEWEVKRLGEISTIKKGEQLNKVLLNETGKFPSYSGGIEPSGYTNKWNTKSDSIIISEGGNSCGYVNYLKKPFWCGGHCYKIINIIKEIDKNYLYYVLKFNQKKIMRLRVGSGLPNIQKNDLKHLKLIFPPLEEQKAIAEVLQTQDKEIELLEQKLSLWEEQKKGLMQQLLTGRKRLVNVKN